MPTHHHHVPVHICAVCTEWRFQTKPLQPSEQQVEHEMTGRGDPIPSSQIKDNKQRQNKMDSILNSQWLSSSDLIAHIFNSVLKWRKVLPGLVSFAVRINWVK